MFAAVFANCGEVNVPLKLTSSKGIIECFSQSVCVLKDARAV